MRQPVYACAILVDPRGRLLLERRYPRARHAARRLTCYGGRREAYESPSACLRRELGEELAWCPQRLGPATVDLWVDAAWIARFWLLRVTALPQVPPQGPGGWAVQLPGSLLGHPCISPWHRAVLRAWRSGRREVRLGGRVLRSRRAPTTAG